MASAETAYTSSSNLNEVLRVLMEGKKERTFTLKITPGLRKAFTEAIIYLTDPVSKYTINGDAPLTGVKAMLGKSAPKATVELIRLMKSRGEIAAVMVDSRGHKASNRDIDHVLAAAILQVAMMRMSLLERGAFVYNQLPQAINRAGGTQAVAAVLKFLRKHVPWKEVAKMRKSRSLTARTANVILFDKFKQNAPTDLIFNEIKLDPYDSWKKLTAPKMLDLLCAQTDGVPAIERSTQLLDLIEKTIVAISPMTVYVRSIYDDSKRLADIFSESRAEGIVALRKMLDRANQMNYRAQLEYTDSIDNIIDNSAQYITKAWSAFKACLFLGMAAVTAKDVERACFLQEAFKLILEFDIMKPERTALLICACFPWKAVEVMLESRV